MLKTLFQGKGNYKIQKDANGVIRYYYHGNCIGIIQEEAKIFTLDSCGYICYPSTTRALNDLERYYTGKGYKLIKRC